MLSSSRRYAAMNFTRSSIGHVSSQGIRRAWCHPCLGRHLPPLRQRRHRSRGRSSPMSQRSSHPLRTASHRCPAACSPISRLRSHHPAGLRSPIPRRCCHSCLRSDLSPMYPVRTRCIIAHGFLTALPSSPTISRPFLIRILQMRVLSPSPTPFKFRGTQSFPLTPSSHGCEGVSGKPGGAVCAAAETGWARADGRELPENGCLNLLRIALGKRPGKAPDPGACCGAHSRAYWRAISRPKRAVPQSIAGGGFQPFRAWSSVRSFSDRMSRSVAAAWGMTDGQTVRRPRLSEYRRGGGEAARVRRLHVSPRSRREGCRSS